MGHHGWDRRNHQANKEKIAYWVSEPDTGVYNAWNKAVPHIRANGALPGSDDRLVNETVLERIAPHLEEAYPSHRLVMEFYWFQGEGQKKHYSMLENLGLT